MVTTIDPFFLNSALLLLFAHPIALVLNCAHKLEVNEDVLSLFAHSIVYAPNCAHKSMVSLAFVIKCCSGKAEFCIQFVFYS